MNLDRQYEDWKVGDRVDDVDLAELIGRQSESRKGNVVGAFWLGPRPAFGNIFIVTDEDVRIFPGDEPSICPNASIVLPSSWAPEVVTLFREAELLPDGMTIHWTGSSNCECDAPHEP